MLVTAERLRNFVPYVPVADRRRKAGKKLAGLKMKGQTIDPVRIEGSFILSGAPCSNR